MLSLLERVSGEGERSRNGDKHTVGMEPEREKEKEKKNKGIWKTGRNFIALACEEH